MLLQTLRDSKNNEVLLPRALLPRTHSRRAGTAESASQSGTVQVMRRATRGGRASSRNVSRLLLEVWSGGNHFRADFCGGKEEQSSRKTFFPPCTNLCAWIRAVRSVRSFLGRSSSLIFILNLHPNNCARARLLEPRVKPADTPQTGVIGKRIWFGQPNSRAFNA